MLYMVIGIYDDTTRIPLTDGMNKTLLLIGLDQIL